MVAQSDSTSWNSIGTIHYRTSFFPGVGLGCLKAESSKPGMYLLLGWDRDLLYVWAIDAGQGNIFQPELRTSLNFIQWCTSWFMAIGREDRCNFGNYGNGSSTYGYSDSYSCLYLWKILHYLPWSKRCCSSLNFSEVLERRNNEDWRCCCLEQSNPSPYPLRSFENETENFRVTIFQPILGNS